MAGKHRRKDTLHRTRLTLGERLLRIVQLELRDEFLNGEIFYSLKEVQVLAERWRIHYNTIRPHSSLGYRSPAPETWHHEIKTGYGEVESKLRFPLPHTHDGVEILEKIAALN